MMVRKAQNIAEYAIVLSIVIGAVMAMQVYVRRGIQARIKTGTDSFTSISGSFDLEGATASLSSLGQYVPYYDESTGDTFSENIIQEHVIGDGRIQREIVSDITARSAGAKTIQRGTEDASARDSLWEGEFGDSN